MQLCIEKGSGRRLAAKSNHAAPICTKYICNNSLWLVRRSQKKRALHDYCRLPLNMKCIWTHKTMSGQDCGLANSPVKVFRVEKATEAGGCMGSLSAGKSKSAQEGQWSEPVSCGHMSASFSMSTIPVPVSACRQGSWYCRTKSD